MLFFYEALVLNLCLSRVKKSKKPNGELMAETNRWITAFIFPIFLLAMPIYAFAEDMKDIREIRESLIRIEERMVTKEELKAEITAVRNELRSEIKGEIQGVRSEIQGVRGEIKDVRGEIRDIRGEITAVKTEIKEFMLWGFGVTFAGIFALIGFVLWDRRTALAPAIRKSRELEEREEKIEKALREIALKDGNVREALRHVGLLTE